MECADLTALWPAAALAAAGPEPPGTGPQEHEEGRRQQDHLEGNGVRANVTLRRNIITDSSGLGIYTEHVEGLNIEENVLDHNGWNAAYASVPTVRRRPSRPKGSGP